MRWLILFISMQIYNAAHAGDVEELEADVEANVFESEAAERAAQREAKRLEQDKVDYSSEKMKAEQTITEAHTRNAVAKKKFAEVTQETKRLTAELKVIYKERDTALKDLEKSQAELNIANTRLIKVKKEISKIKAQADQARYETEQNRDIAADNEKQRIRLEKEHRAILAKQQRKGKFAGRVHLKPGSSKRTPASTNTK